MTPDEALKLQISGRYSELLRSALDEQSRAQAEGRKPDQFTWTLFVVKACRFIGRTNEAIVHAGHGMELAKELGGPAVLAQAQFGLAVACKCARRYDEALDLLRSAAQTLPTAASEETRAAILLETAETALEAGQRKDAATALTRGSAIVHWLGEPRLLAWSLYLRSQLEEVSPADLQLTAAYEIARTVGCPELQWQILWRLAERAEQYGRENMQEEFTHRAIDILARLAAPLHPSDATPFWRQGARRHFVELTQKRYGAEFLKKVMLAPPIDPGHTPGLMRDMGWDPSLIPEFIRAKLASQVQRP